MNTFNRGKSSQVELDKYHSWIDDIENYDDELLISNDLKRKRYGRIYSHYSFRSILASVFCSDAILKLFAIIFYGILPCGFKMHSKKLSCIWFSVIFILLQWNSFINDIYFVVVYWTSKDYEPSVSVETALIMIILGCSGTVTYTIMVYYFYRKENIFSVSNSYGWSIIPKMQFDLPKVLGDETSVGPKRKDWLLTNLFLLLGLCCMLFVVSSDFALNMYYGFHGIHNFLQNISWVKRFQYYFAVSTKFFGFGATVCSCCIFYAITRDMIRHIEYTENAILVRAKTRDDFYFYHQGLHRYTEKMTASCKHWFAVHSFFFVVLVFAVVHEWFKLMKHKTGTEKYFNDLLVTQIAGTSMTTFAFAFPFISASRVTSKFTKFYVNIAMNCKIPDIPDLLILNNNSGFKLYGLRINTTTAVLAFLSSFTSLLRLCSGFKSSH